MFHQVSHSIFFSHYFKFVHEVNHWLRKPHENFGLEIQAQDGDGMAMAILQPEQGHPDYGKVMALS